VEKGAGTGSEQTQLTVSQSIRLEVARTLMASGYNVLNVDVDAFNALALSIANMIESGTNDATR